MAVRLTDRQKELDSWSETKLQRHVCDVVEGLGGWWNFHRPCRTRNITMTTGFVPMPDLTIWFPGAAHSGLGLDRDGICYVELKATGGTLSTEHYSARQKRMVPGQVETFASMRAAGTPVYVWWARDFDTVMVPALTWWAGQVWHGAPEHASRFAQMGRTDAGYVDVKP